MFYKLHKKNDIVRQSDVLKLIWFKHDMMIGTVYVYSLLLDSK